MDLLETFPATFIGAFLGTFAAFLSERVLRINDAIAVQAAALNNLITDLHLRRALTPITPRTVLAGTNDDSRFATDAVLQIRTGIRDTRLSLRPRASTEFQVLVDMSSACNRYLENVQYNAEDYQFELELLRNTFSDCILTLGSTKGVEAREPGVGALMSPPERTMARGE